MIIDYYFNCFADTGSVLHDWVHIQVNIIQSIKFDSHAARSWSLN